ncbi:universal stress protein [Fodinibacter luteus]|uniref:Universal stress protein n=1 Tax=Fodinibacter luteus TaxID=552064 RepID=A0ABP8KHN7_9MICO
MGAPRVVVGVDGSPLSMAAVTRAAQVASARGLPLHVLHAFAADLPMLGFGELSDGSAVVSTHAHRLVADGVARAHVVDPTLTVTTSIREGYASQALVDAARTAALVVVGAMGHGVFSRASVGAVAMQVVTHARCPVLVVGHENTDPASEDASVVVGVDGSKPSLRALAAAFDEAARGNGALAVVHAWEARSAADPTLASDSSWSAYEAELQRTVEAALTARRAEHPHVKVDYEVLQAEPVSALLERAQGAALLVVGSRGSGGFPGLHVGSTALRLMGRSPCPILFTR